MLNLAPPGLTNVTDYTHLVQPDPPPQTECIYTEDGWSLPCGHTFFVSETGRYETVYREQHAKGRLIAPDIPESDRYETQISACDCPICNQWPEWYPDED